MIGAGEMAPHLEAGSGMLPITSTLREGQAGLRGLPASLASQNGELQIRKDLVSKNQVDSNLRKHPPTSPQAGKKRAGRVQPFFGKQLKCPKLSLVPS